MLAEIQYFFVKTIYGDHNKSKSVKTAIKHVLDTMPANGIGLNIGSGKTKIDSRIKNMEITSGPGIDYVGNAEHIPTTNDMFDIVISQEVLEHVKDPWKAMNEIHRVLKNDGVAYIQLPFTIGFHPCPNDYWRFSKEGIKELVTSSKMQIVETGITVGSATGFYRISVEFFSILLSALLPPLYKPTKAIFSILFFPIKFLDPIFSLSKEKDRIAGGYFVICKKKKL